MDDNYKLFLLNKITSRNSSVQIANLEEISKIIQTIQYIRYKKKDKYSVDRLHDSNLLYQKAYLHGLSIQTLSKGINVTIPQLNINTTLNDPISIGILVRGLLETYLTFYHTNFAVNDAERTISYISWIIYGQKQRIKLNFEKPDTNLLQTNKQLYDKYLQLYEANMQKLEEEKQLINRNIELLKETHVFSEFDNETRNKYIKQLNSNWKFEFLNKSFRTLGYQNILNKVGIRISSFNNLYNHLSWPTHSTSIGISQIADMWNQDRADLLFLNNALLYTNTFLALMSRDVIYNDPDFEIGYKALSQDYKDLINFYNYHFRGNDFTIDSID